MASIPGTSVSRELRTTNRGRAIRKSASPAGALFVVSTTTIAALTGYSGSLGDIINNETSYHLSGVLGAAICIAALALVVELVLGLVQRLVTPRGLKVSKTDAAVSALAPIVTEPA